MFDPKYGNSRSDGAVIGSSTARDPRIGVLAIQGGFEAHERALERLGARQRQVRLPEDLDGLDGLILPGGESTTIAKGIDRHGLAGPIKRFARAGAAVFGTCAGLIVLDRSHLGLMHIVAHRNAFGRQASSFEADLQVKGGGDEPIRAVFIRAPWIESHGSEVEILAEIEGHAVAARQDNLLVSAFHPELTDDLRMHALFLAMVEKTSARKVSTSSGAGNLNA